MRTLLVLLTLAATGAAQIRFEETSARAGLKVTVRNGATGKFHLVELMPGGLAVIDFDADGCPDLFFTSGAALPGLEKTSGQENRLYRNDCRGNFTDVTAKAGVGGSGYSMAPAVADFNNDGFPDLFVAGVHRNLLYRNRGDGTFDDITAAAGFGGSKNWSIAAGWFDADNDGWLDLFVSNYVHWDPATEKPCGLAGQLFYCHPDQYAGQTHQLFRNNRDGTFTDISAASGISRVTGKGMGVAIADYDGDGRMDVLVVNDSLRSFLFRNRGDGKFDERALEDGIALGENGRPIASMGVDFRDLDNDGRPDAVVTGMVNDSFQYFHNQGAPLYFEDASSASGLALATRSLTGWGAVVADFDNDGWKDLFFANSHFPRLGSLMGLKAQLPNRVFRNRDGGRFEDASAASPALASAAFYRGAVAADFDGDGRVDVVVTALGSPAQLYRNTTPAGHWLAFKLTGTRSNRDGIGARIEVELEGGRRLYNHASTAGGYASSQDPLVRFGLGLAQAAKAIRIHWPSGITQPVPITGVDRVIRVTEKAPLP
ncbi:MAG: CRTAC1 family protein [Acidobacteria bacterium]|nr:CRTAC1 family protein [Acidobacteriota bacterium]